MADKIIIAVDKDLHLVTDEYDERDWSSDTTSVQSSLYRGLVEHGRKYQALKPDEYCFPADEKQFETYDAAHLVAVIADADQENPFFRSPVKPRNVLDIGTGKGTWAIDVADIFPETDVRGVDLFPPPISWVPPNCVLEVDDILQPWTYNEKFDLIHLRILACAFSPKETDKLMKQIYDNLAPGGWVEQMEIHPTIYCDDTSVPAGNILFDIGPRFDAAADKSGKPMNIIHTMRASIEKAGFVDVHERNVKWPIGPWPKDKILKDLGAINLSHWLTGMEGYTMFLMTKFGDPEPWTETEVHVYNSQMRKELLNPRHHVYQRSKRVWARKPPADT
ncbi:hypothetical protein N7540_012945 [Penicillium herquei]|nr:hypothetical protein N7540_013251 [Penicillium herquei]KAJ6003823.1 hypothetical protein N7540_013105 [Penicillium herquei]KAJ6004576.1 hypothetical protein N7540_012945 [Penicillium herquei]